MAIMRYISSVKKTLLPAAFLLCLVASFVTAPTTAYAQCEAPGDAAAAATSVIASHTAKIAAIVSTVKSRYQTDLNNMRAVLGLDTVHSVILKKMDWLWDRWEIALREMTQQLSAGAANEGRQMSDVEDASNVLTTALEIGKAAIQAKQLYQPTGPACRFDTAAPAISTSRQIATALTTGYALDFFKVGDNQKGTPAAAGRAALQAERWKIYQEKFCDGSAYNGRAGCADTNINQNMHVLPSRTIFAKETINLADADTREAVNQLLFNITGYTAPDPMLVTALSSSNGKGQRQTHREYIAQMDAVGALAYSVVAERAPGQPAPQIQQQRQRMGIMDASGTPSVREIRESIVEQLWDPNYYKELYDNPSTIAQKELYLKAYNLVMLYDMIAKQEKISNVYAIETAAILDKVGRGRYNVLPGKGVR